MADKATMGQKRKIYCVLNGHTPITNYCFGYHTCARCGEHLGDSLGGAYQNDAAVYLLHVKRVVLGEKIEGCKCLANARALNRKDLAMLPKEIKAELAAALNPSRPRRSRHPRGSP